MKTKLTLTINDQLINLAKKKRMNISKFLEDKLSEELNVKVIKTEQIVINQ